MMMLNGIVDPHQGGYLTPCLMQHLFQLLYQGIGFLKLTLSISLFNSVALLSLRSIDFVAVVQEGFQPLCQINVFGSKILHQAFQLYSGAILYTKKIHFVILFSCLAISVIYSFLHCRSAHSHLHHLQRRLQVTNGVLSYAIKYLREGIYLLAMLPLQKLRSTHK